MNIINLEKKIIFFLFALLIISCKDQNFYVQVESVIVDGDSTCFVGHSVQLNANVFPENASDKSILWSSADPSLATVNAKGLVTGISAGSIKIIATAENGTVEGTYDITVEEKTGLITFTTEGNSFSPRITVIGNPEILWTWSDGTTDTSIEPAKDFGSMGTRTHSLSVNPWSSVTRINIGYGGEDGGAQWDILHPDGEPYKLDQSVSSVQGLDVVIGNLERWYSSYNQIAFLDLRNFTSLTTVECYESSELATVLLGNNVSLMRLCLEDGIVGNSLDLDGCQSLVDLRGALNNYTNLNLGTTPFMDIWHVCVRDNSFTSPELFNNMDLFPNIEELLIWNTNQTGSLIMTSTGTATGIAYLDASQNSYSSVDLRGAFQDESGIGAVVLDENAISEIYLTDCDQITAFYAGSCNLDQSMVDYILEMLDTLGRVDGGESFPSYLTNLDNFTVDISNGANAAPSATGLSHRESLVAKGWTVNTN